MARHAGHGPTFGPPALRRLQRIAPATLRFAVGRYRCALLSLLPESRRRAARRRQRPARAGTTAARWVRRCPWSGSRLRCSRRPRPVPQSRPRGCALLPGATRQPRKRLRPWWSPAEDHHRGCGRYRRSATLPMKGLGVHSPSTAAAARSSSWAAKILPSEVVFVLPQPSLAGPARVKENCRPRSR